MNFEKIISFGVSTEFDYIEQWRIKNLNASNLGVLGLILITLTWYFGSENALVSLAYSCILIVFGLVSIVSLVLNYYQQHKLSFYTTILGYWTTSVILYLYYGYYPQFTVIQILICTGAALLFEFEKTILPIPPVVSALTIISCSIYGYFNPFQLTFTYDIPEPTTLVVLTEVILLFITYGVIAFCNEVNIRYRNQLQENNIILSKQNTIIHEQANELRKLSAVKDNFFANISHELRTPLTLILGPLRRLKGKSILNENDKAVLDNAYKNSEQLLEMVEEILDLTKSDVRTLKLQEKTFDLHQLFEQNANQFQEYAHEKSIQLLTELKAIQGIIVLGDRRKMKTVIKNLLSNAIKFTDEKGKVLVKGSFQDTTLSFEIKDTGIGIPKEDVENIFDRFFQAGNNSQNSAGTGIGLSICKEYVELMNGTITVSSDFGMGSLFRVTIPFKKVIKEAVLKQVHATYETLDTITPKPTLSSHKHILVVEDNTAICTYLNSILKEQYEVMFCKNGLEALDYLEHAEQNPDLVITDLMMPKMDGYELVEQLKMNPEWSRLPIIVLTARIEMKDKLKALRIGVDDYLTKPFLEEELLIRMNNLLVNAMKRKDFVIVSNENNIPSLEPPENTVLLTQEDQKWLQKLEMVTKDSIDDFDLTVESIANKMAISRPQFFRRIKALIGLTPMEYIHQIRFEVARDMLERREYSTVKAVSYSVGYKSERNFSKKFKMRYGKYPSEYLSD